MCCIAARDDHQHPRQPAECDSSDMQNRFGRIQNVVLAVTGDALESTLQLCKCACRSDALGCVTFRLTRCRVGRAKVVSVTAPAGQTHSLPQFLLVLFTFRGSAPSYTQNHLSVHQSLRQTARPHTSCVALQAGAHKRLQKSLQCAVLGRKKCRHRQRRWPWSPSAVFQAGESQRRPSERRLSKTTDAKLG